MCNDSFIVEERKPKKRKPKTAAQALESLMRLAARSEKSSGDVLRLLQQWGVPESERGGVLDKLIKNRFIDDRRYAGAYVREKSRLSGWGWRKISMQLRAKGVSQDVIKEAQELKIPVPVNINEQVYINPRPKRRFGCCR